MVDEDRGVNLDSRPLLTTAMEDSAHISSDGMVENDSVPVKVLAVTDIFSIGKKVVNYGKLQAFLHSQTTLM